MTDLQLTRQQARKLALHSQLLSSRRQLGTGKDSTLRAIEKLGYVQLDTLSVVARAHHHTLWNRLQSYRLDHVDKLQREGKIFEHWAHALAILPMQDYRFSLPMMNRIASGEVHWYPKNKKQTDHVLRRIRSEGPLMAKDFDDKPGSKTMWARAPSKLALEQLFMEGELMIPFRRNFHKVYELRERVLPDWVDTSVPSEAELSRHLVKRYVAANALAQAKEISYLRKGLGNAVRQATLEMVEEGKLAEIEISGSTYYCQPDLLEQASEKLPRSGFRILSPFDNAVIQRQRTQQLFDFDYQIECYVKKEERKYGYFCLPLLYRNKLVGRIDAKADRKSGVLRVLHLHLEKPVGNKDAFYRSFLAELRRFANFNACDSLELEKASGCSEARHQFADIC